MNCVLSYYIYQANYALIQNKNISRKIILNYFPKGMCLRD